MEGAHASALLCRRWLVCWPWRGRCGACAAAAADEVVCAGPL